MSRPNLAQWAMKIAIDVSLRATCARRRVGCVLLNAHGHIMSTGCNGPAAGQVHCIDVPCGGAGLPSGTGLDKCEAVHAEQNALLQCSDVHKIVSCFCTISPCESCVKLLLNTSCRVIYFQVDYPHPRAKVLWERNNRWWVPSLNRRWVKI